MQGGLKPSICICKKGNRVEISKTRCACNSSVVGSLCVSRDWFHLQEQVGQGKDLLSGPVGCKDKQRHPGTQS